MTVAASRSAPSSPRAATVIAAGHNERVQHGDPVAHGEISALRNAGRRASYLDTTLYTTLSPCQMCTGAILLFQIPRVVVGEARTFAGDLGFLRAKGVEVVLLDDAGLHRGDGGVPGALPGGLERGHRRPVTCRAALARNGRPASMRRTSGLGAQPCRDTGGTARFCCPGCRDAYLAGPWQINSQLVSSEVSAEIGERFPDVTALSAALDKTGYMAGDQLAAALFLAVRMGQPILLEGEPGVGKTQAAKSLAEALDTMLVRLAVLRGHLRRRGAVRVELPQAAARHQARRGHARDAARNRPVPRRTSCSSRPLLTALDHPGPRPAVLLIDEVDRADDEFEAFLFEMLAESSVTIPELGHAARRGAAGGDPHLQQDQGPARRAQAALPLPLDRVPRRAPGRRDHQAPGARGERRRWPARSRSPVARLRELGLTKAPGISEAITWAGALTVFGATRLSVGRGGAHAERRRQVPGGRAGGAGGRAGLRRQA